ncbi:hypothetical protein K450DRAFT_247272 [Umbelopsis ramanniana AG]|uniref:F-box domain-containing protein n=1 Tax=Umbelopsis ramanniana AG TaxID=1314678 RepID=A0AAD5E6C9_UMBRA|nr:uncharacterized protein K450DRAFT_247272 [Umbelopsis ramanniana AG]KAI8578323.1 hypothetical protein K450DRAFT_247272 [Umbelopsis ramanniana AG]
MVNNSRLPSEILRYIFQDLSYIDWYSCSCTCWTWNGIANMFLYKNVCWLSDESYQKLMLALTTSNSTSISSYTRASARQKQLGSLINLMELRIRIFSFLSSDLWYLPPLSTLASMTPNVHTVYVRDSREFIEVPSAFDYASKWPKLNTLVLSSLAYYLSSNTINFIDVLNRLQHLDIVYAYSFPEYILPLSPIRLKLQSLKICIFNQLQYEGAKMIIECCRDSLNTLVISWEVTDESHPPLSLDNLILGLPNLKVLGLTYTFHSKFTISSFGEQLEELEIHVNKARREQLEELIGGVLKKTTNLKTLSLGTKVSPFVEDIPMVIQSNLATLQNLYLSCSSGNNLLTSLIMMDVRSENLSTLSFECMNFSDYMIRSLAGIFPKLEYMDLTRGRLSLGQPWIMKESLSLFRYLKGINAKTMFSELVDPSRYNFAKYDLERLSILPATYI